MRGAQAHPSAISRFEARTDGDAIDFRFVLDATSVIDLINRGLPQGPEQDKSRIPHQQESVLVYLDERFEVENAGKPCRRGDASKFSFSTKKDIVEIEARYDCKKTISKVTLISTLFLDEDTPHQILGTFRHERAVERYFFTGGERRATIEVDRLRQRDTPDYEDKAFRMATPPPGAFSSKPDSAPSMGHGRDERAASTPKLGDAEGSTESSAAADGAPEGRVEDAEPVPEADGEAQPIGTGFVAFVGQGSIHIFGGLDHVLFVFCLVVAVRSWKRLAMVLTSFTIAHSITLILGALDLVFVSPRLVEPLIAASIIYVAIENMVRKEPKARVGVTFGFGLIHGLGFSSVLQELGLPTTDLVPALLGFNVGVELGQLMLVAPVFPLMLWLRKGDRSYKRVRIGFSVAVTIIALWWFIERLLGG
jgi:hypothetical protein